MNITETLKLMLSNPEREKKELTPFQVESFIRDYCHDDLSSRDRFIKANNLSDLVRCLKDGYSLNEALNLYSPSFTISRNDFSEAVYDLYQSVYGVARPHKRSFAVHSRVVRKGSVFPVSNNKKTTSKSKTVKQPANRSPRKVRNNTSKTAFTRTVLDNIKINTVSGNVRLESSSRVKHTRVFIEGMEITTNSSYFNVAANMIKTSYEDVRIIIPIQSCGTLNVKTTSGRVSIDDFCGAYNQISIYTASGKVDVKSKSKLKIETLSGDVTVNSVAPRHRDNRIEIKTLNGNGTIKLSGYKIGSIKGNLSLNYNKGNATRCCLLDLSVKTLRGSFKVS